MAWLSGYDKRIELTAASTGITSPLSWFPVTVHCSSGNTNALFTEIGDDTANFDKVAFTQADGTTQLYGDCEQFTTSKSAIYHVGSSGWSLTTGNTTFYMYYASTGSHNTSYISKSGGTAGESVWDSNFVAVYHMQDNTTSTILDATSNDNDGTKKGANEPIEATGFVGKGQDGDETDDYISIGTLGNFTSSMATNKPTMEYIYKGTDTGAHSNGITQSGKSSLFIKMNYDSENVNHAGYIRAYTIDSDSHGLEGAVNANTGITDGNYHHVAGRFDGPNNNIDIFVDGTEKTFTYKKQLTPDNFANITQNFTIMAVNINGTPAQFCNIMDEFRLSNTNRSDAWIAATYDSLFDTLLTYGAEETAPAGEGEATNILFIFSNF